MSHPNRTRFAFFGLLGAVTLGACHDVPHPLDPAVPAEAAAGRALAGADAALLAIVLDDALTRLLPAEHDGDAALGQRLRALRKALSDADETALRRRLDASRRALEAAAMESADADALRRALDEVTRALDHGAAR